MVLSFAKTARETLSCTDMHARVTGTSKLFQQLRCVSWGEGEGGPFRALEDEWTMLPNQKAMRGAQTKHQKSNLAKFTLCLQKKKKRNLCGETHLCVLGEHVQVFR